MLVHAGQLQSKPSYQLVCLRAVVVGVHPPPWSHPPRSVMTSAITSLACVMSAGESVAMVQGSNQSDWEPPAPAPTPCAEAAEEAALLGSPRPLVGEGVLSPEALLCGGLVRLSAA